MAYIFEKSSTWAFATDKTMSDYGTRNVPGWDRPPLNVRIWDKGDTEGSNSLLANHPEERSCKSNTGKDGESSLPEEGGGGEGVWPRSLDGYAIAP